MGSTRAFFLSFFTRHVILERFEPVLWWTKQKREKRERKRELNKQTDKWIKKMRRKKARKRKRNKKIETKYRIKKEKKKSEIITGMRKWNKSFFPSPVFINNFFFSHLPFNFDSEWWWWWWWWLRCHWWWKWILELIEWRILV